MPFPVDVRLVHAAETKLGTKFPAEYIVRVCRENGGAVCVGLDVFWLYPIFDDTDKKRLKRTCNDVVRETIQSRGWIGFPQEAVALGGNDCGDKLVLLPSSDDPQTLGHRVFWWDHETDELHFAADDFGDLKSA